LIGETTVDTDKATVVVHDGVTRGGFPMLRQPDSEGVTNADRFKLTQLKGADPIPAPQAGFKSRSLCELDVLADSQAVVSDYPYLVPTAFTLGGSATVGQTIGVRCTFSTGPTYDYTHVVQSGDTVASISYAIYTAIDQDIRVAAQSAWIVGEYGTTRLLFVARHDNYVTVTNISSSGATTSVVISNSNQLEVGPMITLARVLPDRVWRSGDLQGCLYFVGNDSAGNEFGAGYLTAMLSDVTPGAGKGSLHLGSSDTEVRLDNGAQIAGLGFDPVGGSKGVGTLNCGALYQNGVAVAGTERGTFVPQVAATAGAPTYSYSVQSGIWRRTGDIVYVKGQVRVSSVTGTPSGYLLLTGLPFVCAGGILQVTETGSGSLHARMSGTAAIITDVIASTSSANLVVDGPGVTYSWLPADGLGSVFGFQFSGLIYLS
ncbi:MAG: hypothetical protein HQL37_14160, partial [Alphaproteobacteria bacterium]|nr:hypothetical protein [Alphaproteobacteria bacterium]